MFRVSLIVERPARAAPGVQRKAIGGRGSGPPGRPDRPSLTRPPMTTTERRWIVFSRDGDGCYSKMFDDEAEAFEYVCENASSFEGELETGYRFTIEIEYPSGDTRKHDWTAQVEAQIAADRRYRRELHSDWMASW